MLKSAVTGRRSSSVKAATMKPSSMVILRDDSPSTTALQIRSDLRKPLPSLRSLTTIEEHRPLRELKNNNRAPLLTENSKIDSDEPLKSKDSSSRIKLPIYPNITDMKEFRKKHKLDLKTKVYVVTGGYGDIKRALDKRGWVQNPDPKSRCFDLRWTIKSKEDDIQTLAEHQLVNHFEKNASITTKVGLCRNLRNLVWFSNVDINTIYPKCYDLSDDKDYEDFVEEFKFNKAESILKLYAKLWLEGEVAVAKSMEETVKIAVQVCEKKMTDQDEYLENNGELLSIKITEEEWTILSKDEITIENLAKKKFDARLAKLENGGKTKRSKTKPKRRIIDVKTIAVEKESFVKVDLNDDDNQDNKSEEAEKNELLEKIKELLALLKLKNPQDGLIGDKNIWMLKPGGLSRGRGITCLKDLNEILDVARKNANQWVVQKYIENPLIIHKRKFDIRQWVLVTDWNPLTVWFYEECYVRFSGDEYNTDDLENRFIHLTNNSVTKHQSKEDDPLFEQNMWRMDTFKEHLKQQCGRDIFEEIIKPKMKQSVTWSLESVQDMIGNKKNSFELYGYDYMVDEDFNVWLIEINLSPSLDYSTPVTKRLVKSVSEDLIKVVVDYGMSKKKKRSDIPTGLFTRIHKSKKCVEKPMNSYGLDLICEGVGIQKSDK